MFELPFLIYMENHFLNVLFRYHVGDERSKYSCLPTFSKGYALCELCKKERGRDTYKILT